jgi:hypothetical protein
MRYNDEIYVISDAYGQQVKALEHRIAAQMLLINMYEGEGGFLDKMNKRKTELTQSAEIMLNAIVTDENTWTYNEKILLADNLKTFNTVWAEKVRIAAEGQSQINTIVESTETNIATPTITTPGTSLAGTVSNVISVIGELFGGLLQTGTPYVPETGLYMLHRGERVTPAHQNIGANKIHVEPITINVTITDNADIETLVQKIELATQAGIISGVTTKFR